MFSCPHLAFIFSNIDYAILHNVFHTAVSLQSVGDGSSRSDATLAYSHMGSNLKGVAHMVKPFRQQPLKNQVFVLLWLFLQYPCPLMQSRNPSNLSFQGLPQAPTHRSAFVRSQSAKMAVDPWKR